MELTIYCEDIILKYRVQEGDPEFVEALLMTSLDIAITKQNKVRKPSWRRKMFVCTNSVDHEMELVKTEEMDKVKIDFDHQSPDSTSVYIKLSCNSDVNKLWFKKAQKNMESILRVFEIA